MAGHPPTSRLWSVRGCLHWHFGWSGGGIPVASLRGGVVSILLLVGLWVLLCAAGLVVPLLCRGAGRVSSGEDDSGVMVRPKPLLYNDLGFRHG